MNDSRITIDISAELTQHTTLEESREDFENRHKITKTDTHSLSCTKRYEGEEECAHFLYKLMNSPDNTILPLLPESVTGSDSDYEIDRSGEGIEVEVDFQVHPEVVFLAAKRYAYEKTRNNMIRQVYTVDSILVNWVSNPNGVVNNSARDVTVEVIDLARFARNALSVYCLKHHDPGAIDMDSVPEATDTDFDRREILDRATEPDDE